MNKYISNKYLGVLSLSIILVIALFLTVDLFKSIISTDRYNFNASNPSFSRRSLWHYLLFAIPINSIFYWLIYQGITGLKHSKPRKINILNIAFLVIVVVFVVGIIRWAGTGFDH